LLTFIGIIMVPFMDWLIGELLRDSSKDNSQAKSS
jgi:uncharacterized protein YqgC (DUF456 family)